MTTITVGTTAGLSLTSPSYTNPVVVDSDVMISNNANTGNGVYATTDYWVIQNNGSITSASTFGDGISLLSGSITNAATASISGAVDGIDIGGVGTVVNDGRIASTDTFVIGTYLLGGTYPLGVHLGSGAVTNAASASITGSVSGIFIANYASVAGTVVNYGSIAGIGIGVEMSGAGTVVNDGRIASTGVYGAGVILDSGAVTNAASASITGGAEGICFSNSASVGTVVNYGGIAGTYFGIETPGAGTVANNGRIAATVAGTIGFGVFLGSGAVTNAASASITGAGGGVYISAGTVVNYGNIAGTGNGGIGIELNFGGSVTNAVSASIYSKYLGVSLSGGTLTNAGIIVGNSGTAVSFGGTASNLLVLDPGYGLTGIAIGGTSASNTLELASAASAGTLSGLGTEFVNFEQTTIDTDALWVFNGANTIEAGAMLTELSGVTLTVIGTLVNDGTIIIDPSTLTAGGLTGIGLATIDAGSTLEVQGAVAGAETLMFGGSGAYLHLGSPDSVSGSVTNFASGETIDLKGIDSTTVSYSDGVLTFSGGSFRLSLTNPGSLIFTPSSDGTAVSVLCFCVNTLISTPSGECPVQQLAVGDLVTTYRGVARRIVWIGSGKALATQGRRNAATPVIVCQSALAENVPNRDLRVTKGHSLYIDDVLIPVEFLVNHRSIFWDDNAQEVELYHIELETHDVLVANGAPAESYRDDGNRWLFRNANSGWGLRPQVPCAPVLTGGPVVDAAWRRLLERAGPRPGMPTTDEPDLHLLVDGRRVDAAWRNDVWHVFHLSAPPATVRIISRAGVPQEMGVTRDPRCLGVALQRIMVAHGAQIRTIEAEDALLTDGFHRYEAANNIRWTDGDAAMPAGLFEGFDGPLEIALRLGGRTSYPDEGTLLRVA